MSEPALRFAAVSFGFGTSTLLSDASFELPQTGVTVIMGPAGVGKSTLLRMLARRAQMAPSFWHRGHVFMHGRDVLTDMSLDEARSVVTLFGQKGRLHTANVIDNLVAAYGSPLSRKERRELAEQLIERFGLPADIRAAFDLPVASIPLGLQRRVAIARSCALDPAVLLVDEPTRDVSEREAADLEHQLAREAERRAVLMVTHDQQLARRIGKQLVLLVSGRVGALARCPSFFDEAPANDVVDSFLRTGNCWDQAAVPRTAPGPARATPSGFHWVLPGLLGGMARPGLMRELDEDLDALVALGVHTVVGLEVSHTTRADLQSRGMTVEHLPVVDMRAPPLEPALVILRRTSERMKAGKSTVFHCKAGLGRTGTMLAAWLIFNGASALAAVDEVRSVCARYVQSEEQLEFLSLLSEHCAASRSGDEGSQRQGHG